MRREFIILFNQYEILITQNKKLKSPKRAIYERLLILLLQRMKAAVSFLLPDWKRTLRGSRSWQKFTLPFHVLGSSTAEEERKEHKEEKGKDRASGSSQGLP